MSDHDLVMGIDVGTTSVKATIYAIDGTEASSAAAPTPWSRDPQGTQMDPIRLVRCVATVVDDAVTRLAHDDEARWSGRSVAAVGVTGMGESGVLSDAAGIPLGPIRAWHDDRGDTERVTATIGAETFVRYCGMPLTAQPSLSKILALHHEYPETLRATRFWSVPEWVAHCLGGDPGSELSLASRTGLLDVLTGEPCEAATALVGAPLLGEVTHAGSPAGLVGPRGDRADGLGRVPDSVRGAVLTVAGHDHQTAAYGAGAAADGVLFDSLGTAEALLRFTSQTIDRDAIAELVAAGVTVGRTVVPDHYCALAGLSVGLGLERLSLLLGAQSRSARASLYDASVRTDQPHPPLQASMTGSSVHLTLHADLDRTQAWAHAVESLVALAAGPLTTTRALFGPEHRAVGAGGWLADPTVAAAKRRQLPNLTTSTSVEAGTAGAAKLAGAAAGLLPAPPEGLSPTLSRPDTATNRGVAP